MVAEVLAPTRSGGSLRSARLYLRCLGAHVRSAMEYEASFWIMALTAVISQGVGVVFLWAIFRSVPTINGWQLWDVVLIYGLVTVAEAASQLFAQGTWNLAWIVNSGELDPVLLRPLSPVLPRAERPLVQAPRPALVAPRSVAPPVRRGISACASRTAG